MEAVQRRRYDTAYDAITRLCHQGLPGSDLFTQVSVQLRKVVAFRTAGWLRVDPMTLLPLPGLLLQASHDHASRFIHNEYFEPDVAKFRDIARLQAPVQTLWQATGGSRTAAPATAPSCAGQTAVVLEPARPADLSPLVLDLHGLTNRERQITQLLLRGLPTGQIAQTLFISRHTLSDHMKAIFAKLGVTSRPELTALLLDHVPADSSSGRRGSA